MKVLLTRPSEDAISTSNYLKKLSIESCVAPLLKIKKVRHKKIDGEKYDFFLFTSKNGVRNFNLKNKILSDTKIIFAVGYETKEALVNLGYKNLVNTNGNLDNLKMKIVEYIKPNSTILHPTYLSENSRLENFFNNLDCNYSCVKCYSTEKINEEKSSFEKFMTSKNNSLITLYSSLTAHSFIDEIKKLNLVEYSKKKLFIVISEKVKKILLSFDGFNVFVADHPNEKAMIDLVLKKIRS